VPAGSRPRASVVIASRDKPAQLRLTLACLARQRDAAVPQVIVVDDSPAATARPVVDEALRHLDVTAVAGPLRGRAAARNAGASQATGDTLVFLDDDILVGARFVAAHVAAAGERAFCHGRLRELPASARLLRDLDGASPAAIAVAAGHLATGALGPRFRLVANALERAIEAMAAGRVADVAPWLGCVGANVSMRRSAWEQAGGFAEDFGLAWGCEDLEFGLRLYERGLCRVLAPDALGIHLSHARPGRWDEHGENMAKFVARHPIASVRALPVLLDADGSVDGYVAAVLADLVPLPQPVRTGPTASRPGLLPQHEKGPPCPKSCSATTSSSTRTHVT
jgi:GT2 family glycosyltransferase